jgi:hypothetical protein
LSLLLVACQQLEEPVEVPDTGEAEPAEEDAEAEEPDVEPPTEEPEPTATEVSRVVVIQSLAGSVEASAGGGEFVAASVEMVLVAGDEIRTGEDGQATLLLDDGTIIIVAANSAFTVSELEGTAETPITRFFLNVGDLFTVHEGDLAPDAVYEVETPEGVAAIRSSSLKVTFDPVTGSGEAQCAEGICSFTFDGTTFELTGGEKFAFPGDGVSPMSTEDFLAWLAVLGELGIEVEMLPFCGDGAINQESEECDGADTGSCPAGCTASCTCEYFCGDGLCGGGEDAANCPADCPATCGDGVVSHGEACEARSDCGLEVFWKCTKQCQCEQLPDKPEGDGSDKKKKKIIPE